MKNIAIHNLNFSDKKSARLSAFMFGFTWMHDELKRTWFGPNLV
ncbi:hypothetical protein D020_0543 [Vibrio parahaemolyticus SBR10290]|nr:hypothetical protein VP10329_07092 [Vibrio parahaemolyticus 10329]EQL84564.1 hypothetical protein D052_0495 [Vibrio parahaemolyticus 10290]ESV70325.1 hypothetical protein D021_0604 [Vibrio parahaemolyticus 10296]ESW45936.1 hypothetical protein D022_0581 [Vibrio parahaemolyticus 12310]ETT22651.1 hypothetical protein D023_0523 [Vibrio parahaemolyticus 3256]ETX60165.1 hypothetical protein D020_0543 [Vibrio parahaemolyticus SBR10290]EVU15378.1 hypothetical protein D046_4430 [Vibrio parahaemoly